MDIISPVLQGWREGRLRVQRCTVCDALQFPPRAVCLACRSANLDWTTVEPRGDIHTFTTVHRAPTDRFKARVPYTIALVDLAPGVRMMMNVEGEAPGIGASVTIGFVTASDDPQPRPVARPTATAPAG